MEKALKSKGEHSAIDPRGKPKMAGLNW